MAYEIWETCMLVPGISKSNCSGWVQAWGSILAICAAIAIAWWQRREEHKKTRLTDLATATVVGSRIRLNIDHIVSCLGAIGREWKAAENSFDAAHIDRHLSWLRALNLPTEEQVLRLTPVSPEGAILIVQASEIVRQTILALDALPRNQETNVQELMLELAPLLARSREDFIAVIPLFTKYLPGEFFEEIGKDKGRFKRANPR